MFILKFFIYYILAAGIIEIIFSPGLDVGGDKADYAGFAISLLVAFLAARYTKSHNRKDK